VLENPGSEDSSPCLETNACSAYGRWCSNAKSRHGAGFHLLVIARLLGAGEEIRTLDVNLGKVALYH
jgi:hypothetical protein